MKNKQPKAYTYGKSEVFGSNQLQKTRHKQWEVFKGFRISRQLCTSVHLQKEKPSHSLNFSLSNIYFYEISLPFQGFINRHLIRSLLSSQNSGCIAYREKENSCKKFPRHRVFLPPPNFLFKFWTKLPNIKNSVFDIPFY